MPYRPDFRITDSSTWTARWPDLPATSFVRFLEQAPESPEEEFRNDGSQAVKTVLVDWNSRDQASYLFCGYSTVKGSGSQKYISRVLPMPHKDFVNSNDDYFLFCDQVQKCQGWGVPNGAGQVGDGTNSGDAPAFAEMFDPDTQTPVYRFGKMSLLFKSYTYGVVSDADMPQDSNGNPDESSLLRYVTHNITSGDQYVILPTGGFNFISNNQSVGSLNGSPGVVVPQDIITIRWLYVPKLAVSKRVINPDIFKTYPLDDYRGTVNKSTFMDYPPGCVLFTSSAAEPNVSSFGDLQYTITLSFRAFCPGAAPNGDPLGTNPTNAIGHNHLEALQQDAIPAKGGNPAIAARPAGYYEVANGTTSNINIVNGVNTLGNDGINIYNWREHSALFRIPALA